MNNSAQIIYVRKVDGDILNRARVFRLLSGTYAIQTSVFDGPFEVNINYPKFTTEAEAHRWLEKSAIWQNEKPNEGGDEYA